MFRQRPFAFCLFLALERFESKNCKTFHEGDNLRSGGDQLNLTLAMNWEHLLSARELP